MPFERGKFLHRACALFGVVTQIRVMKQCLSVLAAYVRTLAGDELVAVRKTTHVEETVLDVAVGSGSSGRTTVF